jgi:nicotinamidase-related amidase
MKTALLIIDMQKFFGEMVQRPLSHIQTLNSFFNESSRLVVFTQHGHTEDELIPPIKNQLVRKVGPDNVLMVGSKDWELVPDIWKMARDAPVVAKNTYDAFIDTNLDAVLQDARVERVLVCGVMTDVCCDTTARSAFCRGYETWFISDGCWTDTTEQHERALKSIDFLIGRVYTADEAIELLNEEENKEL